MPNQFIARNGIISKGDLIVTGSLTSTNGFTGSFSGSTSAPGLTTQVTYNNDGVLSADSGFVYSGSNVGIGTTTPSQKLTVEGNIELGTGGYIYGDTTSPYVRLSTTFGAFLGYSADNYITVGGPTTITNANIQIIRFRSNKIISTQPLFVGTSDINDTPTSRLQVKGSGTTNATTAFRVENANASSSLVVLDNGFVGIGTGSAAFNLDVNGTTRLNGNITGTGSLNITIPATNGLVNGIIRGVPVGWGRPHAVDFTIGNYTLSAHDSEIHFGLRNQGVAFVNSQMFIRGIPTIIWGTTPGPNNVSRLAMGVNTTTEYLNGVSYPATTDNYFYISTEMNSPNGSIYSPPISTPLRRKFIFSALELLFQTGPSFGVEAGRIFSNGNWSINSNIDSGAKLHIKGSGTTNATTAFRVENANASGSMVVLDNGNVGIGTTSPSYKLDVSTTSATSALRLLDTTTIYKTFSVDYTSSFVTQLNFGLLGRFEYDGNGGRMTISNLSTQADTSFMRFVMGTTVRIHITGTGNVGIGTSSPTQKLDVSGSIRVRSGFGYTSDFSGGVFGISILNVDGSDNVVIGSTYSPKNVILTSGIRYDFASTGLGINVTSPTARLHIKGSGATSSTTALLVENANASSSMVVLDNGNVGINTGSAQFNLDVNGTTRFNGLSIIQGTTASDTAPLGIELLTTGTGDASWTGADFATGYTHVTGSTTTLTSTLAGVVNNYYQITYTVTGRTAGSFTVAFGGFTSGNLTATGAVGPRATTTDTLVITPTSDFDGVIVLSIKTIGISSASVTFNNSSGTVTNQIRISNLNSNTFIGLNAGSRNTTGVRNTANGVNALLNNTTGGNNTANGFQALVSNTTGTSNTANGFQALVSNTTGTSNTANGGSALQNNTTGVNNTANGVQALQNNTTGANNTANGVLALQSNTTGTNNTANGFQALQSNTTGGSNTANGYQALFSNTTGTSNTANGIQALRNNTTGVNNTANGVQALQNNTTGNNNTANGVGALFSNTTGNNNTANGVNALSNNTTGSFNTANGISAGRFIANGTTANTITNNSVFIGADTKALADNQTNQIVIGHNATGLGSNTAVLGNDSIVTTALKGNVGIGTTAPSARLQVKGSGATSSTTALLVENANASGSMVVLDNGFVGIGTITPTQKLSVVGNITTNGIIYSNFLFAGDGASGIRLDNANNMDFFSKGNFTFSQNDSTAIRTSLYEFSSVANGFTGTNIEQSYFKINPKINQSGTAAYKGLSLNVIETSTGDGSVSDGNDLLWLGVGGSNKFKVTSTGGVRIEDGLTVTGSLILSGSSTLTNIGPAIFSGSLTVTEGITGSFSGSGTIESASFASTASYVNPLVQDVLITGSTFISSSNGTQLQVGNNLLFVSSSGNVGIGTSNPPDKLSINAGNILLDNGRRLKWTDGSFVEGGGTSGVMTFRSLGNYYFNGNNVGIGTLTPTSRLQVKGSGTTSATTAFRVENANASSSLQVRDDGAVAFGGNTGNYITAHNPNGGDGINPNLTGNGLLFYSPRTSAASTGIWLFNHGLSDTGGTDAVIDLRVIGGVSTADKTISYTSIASTPVVNNTGGAVTLRGFYFAPSITNATGTTLNAFESTRGNILFQSGSTPLLFVSESGRVGIGISTPSASLHISGASSNILLEIDSPAVNNILFVSGSGNVGIGTSTPASSLHISGASAVLTLSPQDPLPTGSPTGSFAVSASVPPIPYFYDGTTWNALY
jgi:hypothetical protein